MTDLIVMGILIIIVGAAIVYIVKEKKRGTRCIGCPAAGNCPGRNGARSKCSCASQNDTIAYK